MIRLIPSVGLALLAALFGSSAALAQRGAGIDSVRALVRRLMDERNVPSVAVAAAVDGRIVWEEGFGLADRARRIPADPHTMYSLASISKPITGAGLMVLVQRGRVDLERPVNAYLGAGKLTAYEGSATAATVRRVANHTAGLPLHYQFFYDGDAYGRPSMDEAIARYGILVRPPGTGFTYSNLGYGVLERVIERESGVAYEEFMRRELFAPLGLTRMAVVTAPPSGDSIAIRYDPARRPIPWYDFDHRGASAVYASAHDLVRFGMFHLERPGEDGDRVLSNASLDELLRPTARRFPTVQYGIGWATYEDDDGRRSLGHGGGMPGVATSLRIYPAVNAVVVVLVNVAGNGTASEITQAIARHVLPRSGAAAPGPSAAPPAGFQPPTSLLGAWAGTLRTWQGQVPLRIVVETGTIRVSLGGGPDVVVARPLWEGDRLTGRFDGAIPTPDAGRAPGQVVFDLRAVDGRLSGAMSHLAPDTYALSSYVRLERVSP